MLKHFIFSHRTTFILFFNRSQQKTIIKWIGNELADWMTIWKSASCGLSYSVAENRSNAIITFQCNIHVAHTLCQPGCACARAILIWISVICLNKQTNIMKYAMDKMHRCHNQFIDFLCYFEHFPTDFTYNFIKQCKHIGHQIFEMQIINQQAF